MVITGLIKGRIDKDQSIEEIIKCCKLFKKINPKNEIVFSTFENETPAEILKLVDKLVINVDPGPDLFIQDRWPFSRGNNQPLEIHYTRFFLTNLAGIKKCKNNLILKARIEMMPMNQEKLMELIRQYQSSQNCIDGKIGFFIEHYSGVRSAIDGVIGGLPGTVQLGSRSTLEKIYSESLNLWTQEKERFYQKKHVVTSEQILGLTYFYWFFGYSLYSKLNNLSKYYISIDLIKIIMRAELTNFIYFKLKDSGFILYKYKGTLYIKTPINIYKQTRVEIVFRLLILLVKRYKHMYRRYRLAKY